MATSPSTALKKPKPKCQPFSFHLSIPVDKDRQVDTAKNLVRLTNLRNDLIQDQTWQKVTEYLILLLGLADALEMPTTKKKIMLHRPMQYVNEGLQCSHPTFDLAYWLVAFGRSSIELCILQLVNTFHTLFAKFPRMSNVRVTTDKFLIDVSWDDTLRYGRRFMALARDFLTRFSKTWKSVHREVSGMSADESKMNTHLLPESIKALVHYVGCLLQMTQAIHAYRSSLSGSLPSTSPSVPAPLIPEALEWMGEVILLEDTIQTTIRLLPDAETIFQQNEIWKSMKSVMYGLLYARFEADGEVALQEWALRQTPETWFTKEKKEIGSKLAACHQIPLTSSTAASQMRSRFYDLFRNPPQSEPLFCRALPPLINTLPKFVLFVPDS